MEGGDWGWTGDRTRLETHSSAGAQDVLTLGSALSRAFSAPGQGAHREKEAAPDLDSHLPAPGCFLGLFQQPQHVLWDTLVSGIFFTPREEGRLRVKFS